MRAIFVSLVLVLCLTACENEERADQASNYSDQTLPPLVSPQDWPELANGLSWQWQLSGPVNIGYDVTVYDIDLFDIDKATIEALHNQNRIVICYFSAGSFEAWRDDADLFLTQELGDPLDGWEDERWLDIRSDNVMQIMKERISLAATKGCDAVEPDNVDGYTNNSGFNLTYDDQLNFNAALATYAHQQGLAIGLKNDLDQVVQLVEYFDFAVNEQCFEYNECDLLQPFVAANKAAFNAEYNFYWVQNEAARQALCTEALSLGLSTLVMPIELDDSFRFSCSP